MFRHWRTVRPSNWYSLASLEQSMMELDHFAERMLSGSFPSYFGMVQVPRIEEDSDFFKDLPMTDNTTVDMKKSNKQNLKGPRPFSSYSYSSSTMVDDKGQRLESTRRRYEDSSGRMKAWHERRIGDRLLKSVWDRVNKDDEGHHEQVCSSGTPETFEKMWKETAYGELQEMRLAEDIQKVIASEKENENDQEVAEDTEDPKFHEKKEDVAKKNN